jgi:hypothetical protein
MVGLELLAGVSFAFAVGVTVAARTMEPSIVRKRLCAMPGLQFGDTMSESVPL